MSVASAVFAAVAALAALGAVWYARKTVIEARAARAEEAKAHAEQMTELEAATSATLKQTQAAAAQSARGIVAELTLRQMEQAERISALLLTIADVARDETRNPPERLGPAVTGSRLPALLFHLQHSVRIFQMITDDSKMLQKTAEFAAKGYGGGSQAIAFLGGAIDALYEVGALLEADRSMEGLYGTSSAD